MEQLNSTTFISEIERIFGFLRDNGFVTTSPDRDSSSLTAGIRFRGKHVAVSLGLDRRDECVDCYITRIIDGEIARNDVPGGYWGHLHAFLVKHRGYRGAFREFKDEASENEWWVSELNTYAEALKQLAPDIVTDADDIFDKKIRGNA